MKNSNLPAGIVIGFEGEQYAREIRLDISQELALWPGAVPTLFYIRPGEKAAYPAVTTLNDKNLLWTPDAFAMAKAGATGTMQVVFTVAGENTIIGKSPVIKLFVRNSIDGSTGEPEAFESWLASLTEVAATAVNAQTGVETAQGLAEAAQELAEKAQGLAEDAQEAAEAARDLAAQSANAADASAVIAARNASALLAVADSHGVL